MAFAPKVILVPTDFSEAGNRAVSTAFALAKAHDARVLLANVLALPGEPSALYALPSPDMMAEVEGLARERLEKLVPADSRRVAHEVLVTHGSAAGELCRLAKEHEASLIVMSSQGHSALARFLLGSVTERVVRHAPCSVLVVRG